MQVSVNDNNLLDQYKQTFIDGVRFGVKNNYLDSRLSEFDLEKLGNSLIVERDSLFEFIGIQTLYERYILRWSLMKLKNY